MGYSKMTAFVIVVRTAPKAAARASSGVLGTTPGQAA